MEEKINFLKHYQNSIEKSQDDPERVLHCLKKLQNVRINVQMLKETGIGRTVNSVRELDGEAGQLAKTLITKWKSLVSEVESGKSDEREEEQPVKSESKNSHHSKSSSENLAEEEDNNISNNKKSKSHHSSSSSHQHHHHHHSSSSKHKHKDEHKKSNDSKSSESKNHYKSHHHSSHKSSTSSSSSSPSKKRSYEDDALTESKENESKAKKMKIESDKSDEKKSSRRNEHSSSSSSKNKEHKKSSSKRKHSNDEEFDGTQGIGFADILASFDMKSSKKSKQPEQQLADKIVKSSKKEKEKDKQQHKSSSSSSSVKASTSSSSSSTQRPSTSSSSSTMGEKKKSIETLTQPPMSLTQKPKLDLLPDIVKELPNEIQIPDYRPLPLNSTIKDYINSSVYGSTSSQGSRHAKQLTDAELLVESFSSKSNRMKVYSGNKNMRAEIPRLFDMCIRILQENIDFLECTGGVPFEILKPVLERAKPDQLSVIEYYNPYLLDDSDLLWQPHCQRKWKNRQPLEMESWREMFERCTKEDEEKLSRLTQNIRQHQEITSNGIQKTKMAYVDSMVKPPRNVMRKQEQFGTSRKLVASPAARVDALKNLTPNLVSGRTGDVRLRVASGLRDDAQQVVGRGNMQRNMAKKAPLMQKILSKFKR